MTFSTDGRNIPDVVINDNTGTPIGTVTNPLKVSGSFSATTAGTYNVTPPTMTNGTSGPLQTDVNGNLKISGVINASTVGAYHASPPTFVDGNSAVPLQTDVNGNLKVAGSFSATTTATYNSSPPSYSNGTANPLQADINGRLKTQSILSDGTNGPVAVKAASTPAAATDPSLVVALSPNSPVSQVDSSMGSGSVSSATVLFSVATSGFNSLSVVFTAGTGNTIVFDGSNDNVTWVSGITLYRPDNYSSTPASSLFISGVQGAQVPASFSYVRCRVSVYASGTVTAAYALKNNAATLGQQPIVKAASTAPAATDPALVVALSPNSDAAFGSGLTATAIGALSATGFSATGQNTAGFGKLLLTVTTGNTSTIAWQGSNDAGVTWEPLIATRLDSTAVAGVSSFTSFTTGQIFEVPCAHALIRLYCSSYTSQVTFSWCFKVAGPSRLVVDQGAANAAATWPTSAVIKTSYTGGIPSLGTINGVINSVNTTNGTSIKTTGGQVYSIDLSNNAATWAYFRLYNKASAPTVGTDPVLAEYGIGPGASRTISFSDLGLLFATGIAYSITAGAATNDTTALAANNTVVGTIHYN